MSHTHVFNKLLIAHLLAALLVALIGTPAGAAPSLRTETVRLVGSDTAAGDQFGNRLAISGNTLVVGALGNGDDDAGAAYVFERAEGEAGGWSELKKLTASDRATGDCFGYSVAVDGDTLVVGAHYEADLAGSAYVFERNNGGEDAWGEVVKLVALDAAVPDQFGVSVGISGDVIVVGAYGKATYTGAAYVFERNQGGPGAWGQVAKLVAPGGTQWDMFGYSVGISGDTLAVGAYDGKYQSKTGTVYVFERDQGGPGAWGHVAELGASDPAGEDELGHSVAIDGDILIAGAPGKLSGTGAAYVFERNSGGADAWGQTAKLVAFDPTTSNHLGNAVAVEGGTLVVGAYGRTTHTGAAYVFERDSGGGVWSVSNKLVASDAATYAQFGVSLGISGDLLIAGANGTRSNGSYSGAVYVFEMADLALGKHVDPAAGGSAAPGQPVTYTLAYSNTGLVAATGVVITDIIPPDVTGTSVISGGAVITPLEGARYAWSVADLAPGEGGVITITGVLTSPLAARIITNTATMATTAMDADLMNNQASAGVMVEPVADLALSKRVAPPSVVPGQPVTYTLVYSNVGVATAAGVVITDAIPPGVTGTSVTSSGAALTALAGARYAWSVADLAPGEGGVITIAGVLSGPLAPSIITNTATVTTTIDTDVTNNDAWAEVTVEVKQVFLPLAVEP